jgi:phosphate:Na+ symporter
MSVQTLLNAAGGLALFLLAMQMMTVGLEVFAGSRLRDLLGRWTSTPARGVLAGMLVTGVVQSSSAVTVATIGFVNAGMLTLRQALGVIFGCNVGTTMTGWLVSLVGFGVDIEAFALPMVAVGVTLRLTLPGKRRQGLGDALAGFGLFFLGLAILKDAFAAVAETYGSALGGAAADSTLTLLLVGFVATVLLQSSSASLAMILSAVSGGVLDVDVAAAAVIGANLGTTSTAAIAALTATPAAKRLAIGHIAFNAVTGAVALLLLPLLLWVVAALADWLGVGGGPAAALALFHTVFNVLGVGIMLPLTNRLGALLERLFHRAEEQLERPQYLDATLAASPVLAVQALRQELLRLRDVVVGLVQAATAGASSPAAPMEPRVDAVRRLVAAVGSFIARVRTERMPLDVVEDLSRALRIARYLGEAARLSPRVCELRAETARLTDGAEREALAVLVGQAETCLALAARAADAPDSDRASEAALAGFESGYQRAKSALLAGAVGGRLAAPVADVLLDALSVTRRLLEQIVKADRLLRSPGEAATIEAQVDPTAVQGADPSGPAAPQ